MESFSYFLLSLSRILFCVILFSEMTDLNELKTETAQVMRRLVAHGLTTTTGGNVSARTESGVICITPSQIDKEYITADQIGVITQDSVQLEKGLKLSMETAMHRVVYRQRPEVRAVVHAHPPWATSFTASASERLRTDLIAETWALLGDPVWVPYALMGTEDLAARVGEAVLHGEVLLLENHGVLALGTGLWQAFSRLEALEEAAKISVITGMIGEQRPLGAHRKVDIDRMMGK